MICDWYRSMEGKSIDLFVGCDGLSLGLYNAGWNGLFAIERNKMAFETLKQRITDQGTPQGGVLSPAQNI